MKIKKNIIVSTDWKIDSRENALLLNHLLFLRIDDIARPYPRSILSSLISSCDSDFVCYRNIYRMNLDSQRGRKSRGIPGVRYLNESLITNALGQADCYLSSSSVHFCSFHLSACNLIGINLSWRFVSHDESVTQCLINYTFSIKSI